MLFSSLWKFIKHPVYEEDTVSDINHKLKDSFQLLALALGLSLFLGMLIATVESTTELDLGQHAMDRFLAEHPVYLVMLAAVVIAPLLEELIFRGPLMFFRNSRFFPLVFYAATFIFAFYHITNFDIGTEILLLSPLLVAPQLCMGVILGYLRVRFGLAWAMLLHASYNAVLIIPVLLLNYLNIPLS